MANIDRFYLNYFDGIDVKRVNSLMSVCANVIAQHNPQELYFLFASPGGDVNSGIVLYNYLKALPTKIIMHNMGIVDSIGNIIFAAGEERYACPHSTFLFHGVKMNTSQNSGFSVEQLNELRSRLESDQLKIANILQVNTTLTEEEILGFFREGESKDAEFARDKQIVHDVRVAKIPNGAPFVTINTN